MFLSKIWFFVVGTVAMLAIGISMAMPRPAERKVLESEDERLKRGRWGVEMLLRKNAGDWLDLASAFSLQPAPAGQPRLKLDAVLDEASKADRIGDTTQATARETLRYIYSQVTGPSKPEIVLALDKWGRVVANIGANDKVVGDDLSSYFLVSDALRGYLRDDLWYEGGKLYRMAASPVIDRSRLEYVGAIVLGDEVDLPLAKALADSVGAQVAFFVRGEAVAKSDPAPINQDIQKEFDARKAEINALDESGKPVSTPPFSVVAGDKTYQVALKRLRGEAGAQDGFLAVFAQRPKAVGFFGTLAGVTKDDLGFANFPWITLGVGFVVLIVGGMLLMWTESDRPLRRLLEDSIALGKGDAQKLAEEQHRGKFGSVARSVNIALEKLSKGAKARSKDLGALLGPPPEDGVMGAMASKSGGAFAPPPAGGAFAPPPPSDFSFDQPAAGAPVSHAPMHLGVNDTPSLADFGMGAPPPPASVAPPAPPVVPRRTQTPPSVPVMAPPPPPAVMPAIPSMDSIKTTPAPSARSSAPPPRPAAPPPATPAFRPVATPPPPASRPPQPTSSIPVLTALDDDLLAPNLDEDMLDDTRSAIPPEILRRANAAGANDFGGATVVADPSEDLLRASADDGEASYFRQVFDDFVELKRKCGEGVEGLTFDKFQVKLRQNRDSLVQKYACKGVRFQVYVKDGKAALKATPLKA